MEQQHIISVDYEAWFQGNSFKKAVPRDTWDRYDARIPYQTDVLLELFSRFNLTATFFIVGWVAERFPDQVRRIAAAGHEIASHGTLHRLIPDLGPEGFRTDLTASKKRLEDITGNRVEGYRAPNWSLNSDSMWAADILQETGFSYDSSIFPINIKYGQKDTPRYPYRLPNGLEEYPLSTLRIAGNNIPMGGGIFFRAQPLWLTRYAVARYTRACHPFILYIHSWELDPDHSRLKLGFKSEFIHYHNLGATRSRLESLFSRFRFTAFRNLRKET